MKFDFHDVQTLVKVRIAISELIHELDNAVIRLKDSTLNCLNTTFEQFTCEISNYKSTTQYELLKAYHKSHSRTNFFEAFDDEFFAILANSERTVGDFILVLEKIKNVMNQLYTEACFISENYL